MPREKERRAGVSKCGGCDANTIPEARAERYVRFCDNRVTIPSALSESWRAALGPVLLTPEMRALERTLAAEAAAGKTIYPPPALRFAAFERTPLPRVRAVILGQDPYHGPDQAHGLAFSVPPGARVPPSLRNIYRELEADLGLPRPDHGNLACWADQGVLLLNTALTVEAGRAGSHHNRGWEALTDAAITAVAALQTPVAFLLWGAHAQKTAARVPRLQEGPHLLLRAPHPSPLSARTGFFGCQHFSQTNAFLSANGRGTIDWSVPPPADLPLHDLFSAAVR
jgi:uracil-DNA glycosylase